MKKEYSLEHKKYLRKLTIENVCIHFSQIALLLIIIFAWEGMANSGIVDPFITSSPSRIVKQLCTMIQDGTIWQHVGVTMYETLLAFVISTILGSLVAILLYMFLPLKRVLEPYLVILNSLPKIALGPLIIIWVGAGTKAIIVMCILICVIVTTLSLLGSFLSCDKEKILLMRSMNAKKHQIFFKLIVPNSMPDFISVLKINVGMSWIGTIMGEYLVSKAGLGYLIVYGGTVFKLDLVMTSTVILCLLAGGMYFIIARIESHFRR